MQIRKVQRKQAEALIKKRGIAMAKSLKKSLYFTDEELGVIYLALDTQKFHQGQGVDLSGEECEGTESAMRKVAHEQKNRESK